MVPSSALIRFASACAAMRRGCVWPIMPVAPRPSSRQILGSCVLLPLPVAPLTITTWRDRGSPARCRPGAACTGRRAVVANGRHRSRRASTHATDAAPSRRSISRGSACVVGRRSTAFCSRGRSRTANAAAGLHNAVARNGGMRQRSARPFVSTSSCFARTQSDSSSARARLRRIPALDAQQVLHVPEATLELATGIAQRDLGVHAQVPRRLRETEEQVPEFLADASLRPVASTARSSPSSSAHLVEHALHVRASRIRRAAAREPSLAARVSAGRPSATPSSAPVLHASSSPLVRLVRFPGTRLFGRGVTGVSSPKTCGCRRSSLSQIAAATSSKSNRPCSSAMRAWNTTWNSRSPSSSEHARLDRRAAWRRRPRRLPRSCAAQCVAQVCSRSHGQPRCGSRSRDHDREQALDADAHAPVRAGATR